MCEVICRAGLVVFPRDFPVFVRASRLHDELLAGELERTGQIFADQSAHQGAFDVEGESMGAFVDFERTKGGLVPTLRVLLRSSVSLRLWAAFHDLNRHVTVACEDEQPGRVGLLNFPVWTWRFERDQSRF
jgi:hypothetical protein